MSYSIIYLPTCAYTKKKQESNYSDTGRTDKHKMYRQRETIARMFYNLIYNCRVPR